MNRSAFKSASFKRRKKKLASQQAKEKPGNLIMLLRI